MQDNNIKVSLDKSLSLLDLVQLSHLPAGQMQHALEKI